MKRHSREHIWGLNFIKSWMHVLHLFSNIFTSGWMLVQKELWLRYHFVRTRNIFLAFWWFPVKKKRNLWKCCSFAFFCCCCSCFFSVLSSCFPYPQYAFYSLVTTFHYTNLIVFNNLDDALKICIIFCNIYLYISTSVHEWIHYFVILSYFSVFRVVYGNSH